MRVPLAEQSVRVQVPSVQEVKVPGAVSGQFGEQIGAATEQAGQQLSKVGDTTLDFAYKQAIYETEEKAAEMALDFTNKTQDILYNDRDVTRFDANNKPYTIVDGLKNRTRKNAVGITEEYDKRTGELISERLKNMPEGRLKSEFIRKAKATVLTYRDDILQHEVKEKNEQSKDVAVNTVNQNLLLYQAATTPEAKQKFLAENDAYMEKQYARGVLDLSEYTTLQEKTRWKTFLIDFEKDPIGTEKKFNADNYGMNIEYIEKAQTKMNEIKIAAKLQATDNYSKAVDELDTMSFERLDQLKPTLLPADYTRIYNAYISKTKEKISTPDFKKIKQAIDYIMPNNIENRTLMYDAVLDAYEGGIDPKTDEGKFIKKIVDLKKDKVKSDKLSDGHHQVQAFFNSWWGKRIDFEDQTQMLLKMAYAISNDVPVNDAMKEIVKTQISKDYPDTALSDEVEAVFEPGKGLTKVPKISEGTKPKK